MIPIPLSTTRLNLRRGYEADAPNLFYNYCANPTSSRFLTRQPHQTVKETSAFIEKWCNIPWLQDSSMFAWIIALKEDDTAIGTFLVNVDGNEAQIHYGISCQFEGQGLITEAGKRIISWLLENNLQEIWTVCDVENYSSIKVLEKLGFKNNGILKKHLKLPAFGNQPRDCLKYTLPYSNNAKGAIH